ncbi:MAG: metallophosphoesterase [Deltaproteobacteria bacterium]|nr:metallophosphoesterase [Deltaproteobacteria bacterium]
MATSLAVMACAGGGGAPPDAALAPDGLDGAVAADGGDAAPPARDWAASPPVVEVDTTEDVYALGDVHGDYDRMLALLAGAGLVEPLTQPADARWRAGAAVLVCTGDLLDKWPQAVDVITYLDALGAAAASAGGRVIVIMGNHEAEFLANPADSKVAEFVAELEGRGLAPAEVAAGKGAVGRFLRDLPFAARVNEWFFVHAGNTGGRTLGELEGDLVTGIDAAGFGAPVLAASSSLLEAEPPWWELGGQDPATVLAAAAAALGIVHLVQGHKPGEIQFSDGTTRPRGVVHQKFGRIFFIDVGMSRGVDYTTGALLHIRGAGSQAAASVVYPDGTATPLPY